jgi:hypothetical protein
MAFTRFHDDEARIIRQLQQQTDQERWYLDTPGNGDKPCFILDPQIIPQKWGGNLWTHSTDIQSSLLGIDRQLNRDCIDQAKYKRQTGYIFNNRTIKSNNASMDSKRFTTKPRIYFTK